MATVPVKGADTATYQLSIPSLGSTPAAAALSVIPSPDGTHAKTADITALSVAITGALAATQVVSVTGTAAVTQSGSWTVGLAAGATVALAGGNTVALKVDGSAVTQPVSFAAGATVAVGNFPAIQPISDAGGSLTIDSPQLPSSIGQKASSNSLSVVLASNSDPVPTVDAADQDPIFDHANGVKVSVTTSATVLTPPAGCKYVRISADVDIFVNTAGIATVVDDGTAIRLLANSPEVIPVVAGVPVKALSSSGTAVVRVTPLKVR